MSNVKKQEEENDEAPAPFHVLMASKRPLPELLVKDDLLQRDYLAKRFQILHPETEQSDIWSAALPIERAMMECCQLEEIRASLQRGKELDFCRLLAMHCHTAATRGLALAILEKTMEQDALEAPVFVESFVEEEENVVATDQTSGTDITSETKPLVKQQEHESNDMNVNDIYIGRMSQFLQAGGIKILKQWLIDAMTPIKTFIAKQSDAPSSSTTTPPPTDKSPAGTRVLITIPSPTGPLLLPLLQILTDMPCDKQFILSCKINKPIKKLRKQLDQAISVRRSNRTDTKDWTDPVAGGLVVDHVETAVSKLMESWQTKPPTTTISQNPFAFLQEKMKHRCELLKDYEVGDGEKPSFFETFETEELVKKEAQVVSKLSMEQRAARERQQERQQMLKVVQQKQSEAKAKMDALLKKRNEESRKRKAEGTLVSNETKRIRRVRWKDESPNKRHLLVQVHVYTKDSDVGDEYDEAVKREDEENDGNDYEGDGIPFADEDDTDDTGGAATVKQEEP